MTLMCPFCKATLEGDVEATDIVECPTCTQSFVAESAIVPSAPRVQVKSLPKKRPSVSYDGLYKSSDDKLCSGVCSGIAHKFKLNRGGVRLTCFLLMCFFWIPFFIYIGMALCLPSRPTLRS